MLRNKDLRFICRYFYLRVENDKTPFTTSCQKNQVLKIPIAHSDGNYYISDEGLEKLKRNDQIVLRYCDPQGRITDKANPNGSKYNIAGICNKQRNVFGMMPHPERCSERVLGSQDGLGIFKSITKHLQKGVKT
jgi:phosphoribosylformylglycinamidine synthase subunit PurQ / glutaminase